MEYRNMDYRSESHGRLGLALLPFRVSRHSLPPQSIRVADFPQHELVTGFLPSRCGLGFPNRFAHTPLLRLPLPTWLPSRWAGCQLRIGDASRGLCGGMAATARDLYDARLPAPGPQVPVEGDRLYSWLVRRSLASFGMPLGPLQYYLRMLLGNGRGVLSGAGLGAWNRRAWRSIEAQLQAGRPCPIGLVQVRSANPFRLGENHQVLVWGARISPDVVRMQIYDPNVPGSDDQFVDFSPATGRVSGTSGRVRGFFRSPYRPLRDVAMLRRAIGASGGNREAPPVTTPL